MVVVAPDVPLFCPAHTDMEMKENKGKAERCNILGSMRGLRGEYNTDIHNAYQLNCSLWTDI